MLVLSFTKSHKLCMMMSHDMNGGTIEFLIYQPKSSSSLSIYDSNSKYILYAYAIIAAVKLHHFRVRIMRLRWLFLVCIVRFGARWNAFHNSCSLSSLIIRSELPFICELSVDNFVKATLYHELHNNDRMWNKQSKDKWKK
jgi:hypothetical protein